MGFPGWRAGACAALSRVAVVLAGLMAALLFRVVAAAETCVATRSWSDWQAFQKDLIRPEGRVVDLSDPRQITTSEGQSYALFFALVDNDRVLFRRLLRWTERYLADGDLTARLPAWLWGRDPAGQWRVLDNNTASDSNLWIAYSLLEAGRLWNEHSYRVLGTLMLQRMAAEEIVNVPGLGTMLLPGKQGFVSSQGVRLNPSYVPPQLLARASLDQPDSSWTRVLDSTNEFLISTSPLGVAPDWVDWHDGGVRHTDAGRTGSYNAIRVYLWVGMLHPDTFGATQLWDHFRRGVRYLDVGGLPAEKVDILDGSASSPGPIGFSAALLPLFGDTSFGELQRQRLNASVLQEAGYYSRVLALFGVGWDQERYAFDAQGRLRPAWEDCP